MNEFKEQDTGRIIKEQDTGRIIRFIPKDFTKTKI